MSKWNDKLPLLRQLALTHTPEQIAQQLGTTVANTHKIAQRNNITLRRPVADPRRIKAGMVEHIAVDQLRPDPAQPRRHFNPDTLAELGKALAKHQESPIKARVAADHDGEGAPLIIVHGERRWRAAQLAGLATVQVLLDAAPEDDASDRLLRQIDDNVQREDLDVMDLAAAYQALHDEHGVSVQSIADRVGSSRPVVSNLIRLLQLPQPVQDMIRSGWLTPSHGKTLLTVKCDQVRSDLIDHLAEQQAKGAAPGNISVLMANALFGYTTRHIELASARFDTAGTCTKCTNRHTVKPSDSADAMPLAFCTHRECFDRHQSANVTKAGEAMASKPAPMTSQEPMADKPAVEPKRTEPVTAMPPAQPAEQDQPDPLLEEARQHLAASKMLTGSQLGSTLGIGYNRACRLLEALERDGAAVPVDKHPGAYRSTTTTPDDSADAHQPDQDQEQIQPEHTTGQQIRIERHKLAQTVAAAAAGADPTAVAIIIGLAAFGAEANGEEDGMTLQQVADRIARDGINLFLADVAARSVEWLRHHEVQAVAAHLGLTEAKAQTDQAA